MLFWKLLPALVWALIILLLTGLPGTYFPTVISFWDWLSPDKLVHVFIFFVQTFLILVAFRTQYLLGNRRLVYTWLLISIITVFALLTEVLQAYVFVGRDGNVYDFIADFVGVLVGYLAYNLFFNKKFNNNNKINR